MTVMCVAEFPIYTADPENSFERKNTLQIVIPNVIFKCSKGVLVFKETHLNGTPHAST